MLNEIKGIIAETKSHIKPLSEKGTYSYSTALYFRYYELDLIDNKTEHLFGSFQSGQYILAAHIFRPQEYKAAAVILHGYLGHCGTFGKYVKYLLESGFAVAAFDLPGHGLSSGEQGAIDDFSQYSDLLGEFLKIVKSYLHGPYHIIGHSTGAAIMIDYLSGGGCFDKVILAAPLVRCGLWSAAKIGYKMYHPFATNIFRVFWNLSSDGDYCKFIKYKDPLQGRKVSLNWVRALFKWNEKITAVQKINKPIFVIQGTNDTTVAWKYNIKFIQSKFSRAEIELIENGRHELFNESADIRKEVFSQIRSYLNDLY